MISEFEGPIPGESLTREPKSAPWERPPEIVDPEEAIQMHLMHLSDPERREAVADSLQLGVDVQSLVKGYLRSAVANGRHTTDISYLIMPIIHEEILQIALDAGLVEGEDFEEGLKDKDADKKKRQVEFQKAKRKLQKAKGSTETAQTEEAFPMDSEELPDDIGSGMEESEPDVKGFMKRREKV